MSSSGPPHGGGSLFSGHQLLETNPIYLVIGILVMVAIGGVVEIAPLFYLKNTLEAVHGMRPYTPLELAGRNIYVREGCALCHSQMIRALRDEVERYDLSSLRITTSGGETCALSQPAARGSDANPMSDKDLENKLRDAATNWNPRHDIAPLIDAIWQVEQSDDIASLAALTVPRA